MPLLSAVSIKQDFTYAYIVHKLNPIAYWRLGETSGPTAFDEIDSYDISYGTVTLNQPGALTNDPDTSVRFSGSEEMTLLESDLQITGDLTISCWINPDTLPGLNSSDYFLVCAGSGETESNNVLYAFAIRNTGGTYYLRSFHENGAGSNNIVDISYSISTSTWFHVVQTRNTSTNTYYVYANGVEVSNGGYANNPTGGTSSTFQIGGDGTGSFFDGFMDELSIFNKVLTEEEIKRLYDTGKDIY